MKKIIVPIFCSLLISGCTAVMVGGAATGGYLAGKDKRSVAQIAEDASIISSIKTRMIATSGVPARHINVDTENQIVTLKGHVPSQKIRQKAIAIAQNTKGVKKVIPKLAIVKD